MKEEFERFLKAPDTRSEAKELFGNIKASLAELEKLLEKNSGMWGYQDPLYRFYHQSYKVYNVQQATLEIVEKLKSLAPGREMNEWFMQIVREGTGMVFKGEDNENWLSVTRPIVEAFFHARFFLEMVVKYGKEMEYSPRALPSGWAAVLYLYNLR